MSTINSTRKSIPPGVPPLQPGDHLSRPEFERRFDATPNLKIAELIDGVVYMPRFGIPAIHGGAHFNLVAWLGIYRTATPGIEGGNNGHIRLDFDNMPQPDAFLRILESHGGQSRLDTDNFVVGAPELIAEIAYSSASYDLHAKLNVYRCHGAKEYIVWRVLDGVIDYFVLNEGRFDRLPSIKGIYQSLAFPGLWLDPTAMISDNPIKISAVARQGLATRQHAAFINERKKILKSREVTPTNCKDGLAASAAGSPSANHARQQHPHHRSINKAMPHSKKSIALFLCLTLLTPLALKTPSRAADAPKPTPSKAETLKGDIPKDDIVVDEKTEALIKGAMKWLAAKQQPNGSWNTGRGNEHPVAMTGYTLMAFMAAGQLPGEGEYGKNVTRGMNYLLSCVRADGYITNGGESNMYNHGIATIALAELYGQTRDPKLKTKLDLAVKLIVNCQNQQGGWRYRPAIVDGDVSVTVLQLVAARAALNSGIEVPQSTIDKGVSFVKLCYHPSSGGFTYQPHGNPPGFARTAAAIYSLQVCGRYDDKEVKTGADYLLSKPLQPNGEWFTYGNFYAAPAMYMIGGKTWATWYDKLKKQLINDAGGHLKTEGDMRYWENFDGQGVGPVYATAVYTTILAMPYHYIPLYQR